MAKGTAGTGAARSEGARRKLIEFDAETWHALSVLGRDSLKTIQELAEEAFADLLRKHNRPVEFREALRRSASAAQKKAEPKPASPSPRRTPAGASRARRRR